MDDWRLQGQERYLKGVKLSHADYQPYREGWDHDHCEFCSRKFSLAANDLHKGYVTEDRYHWICEPCFADFANSFGWTIVSP